MIRNERKIKSSKGKENDIDYQGEDDSERAERGRASVLESWERLTGITKGLTPEL